MTEVTEAELTEDVVEAEEELTECTSETPAAAPREPRKAPDKNGGGTGRRKKPLLGFESFLVQVDGLSMVGH